MSHDFIKKEYDTLQDPFAKKNRDSKAQTLREEEYHVTCRRTTHIRGPSIYILDADKEIEETKKEEDIHV